MTQHEIYDQVWAALEPLMPTMTGRSRPWTDHRLAVEGMAWKHRTGAPWGSSGAVREVELALQAVQQVGRVRYLGDGARGGTRTTLHLVCDGRGRPLGMITTGGSINDTTMMTAVLEVIRVPRNGKGRIRARPGRVLAGKGYPSKANRAWLRDRRIAATTLERDDQIAHRRKKPRRPIDFGDQQRERYKGRNVVERCFNKLTQWRGIAMRSDKLLRN